MMGTLRVICGLLACIATLYAQEYELPPDYDWDTETDFDRYVALDDGYYSYEKMAEFRYDNFSTTVHVFNMTSQKWMNESFVDQPVWYHDVGIAIYDDMDLDEVDSCQMLIDGGSNNPNSFPGIDHLANLGIAAIANATKACASYVRQTPNQPLYFQNDPEYRRRTEDALIAWTWKSFWDWLVIDDVHIPEVICRMPMTKGVKRAMDTVQAFYMDELGVSIERFFIMGASKRGWTTWSIAAVDRRVAGIAPMVFSLLNFEETLMKHFQALDGAWSFALKPYYEVNLTQALTHELAPLLFDVEDMFRYRSRLDLPKLLIVATGDEFFLCQDSQYWWDEMPGSKYFLMCPNAEHALFPCWVRLAETMEGFFVTLQHGNTDELPEVKWEWEEHEDSGTIRMETDPPPLQDDDGDWHVRGLRAVTLRNHTRRDYRLIVGYPEQEPHPVWWTGLEDVEYSEDDNTFTYTTDQEEGVWVGYFIEGEWEAKYNNRRMFFTTNVHIIPDTFPRGPCEGMECYGELV